DVQAGVVATVFVAVYGICVPLAGFLGDILRRKRQILFSVFLFSAGTLLTGFGGGLWAMILFYGILFGGGEALYYPPATSLMGQFHENSRATALSIHQTALYLGIMFSGYFSGYLARTMPGGWRAPFLVFGLAGIVWGAVVLLLMRDTPAPAPAAAAARPPLRETLAHILGKRSAIALALAFGCMVYVDVGFKTWTPTFLIETFGFTPEKAGFSAVFYHFLCAFAGVMIGGKLTDRWAGRRRAVRFEANAAGLLLGAPFILLMARSGSEWACFAALGLFGLFRGLYDSNLFASLFDVIKPQYRASATGLMLSFAFLTGSLSPTVLGFLKTRFGLSFGLATLAAAYVLGGVIILIARMLFFGRDYEASPAA
ncbi:MAG: MFS transporter, partial [Kiritimatiellia bacterium]|nr:MFS transporter [Kiritimatiellia bacterium]